MKGTKTRQVTVKCVVCGVEVQGVQNPVTGEVRATSGLHDGPTVDGYCMADAPVTGRPTPDWPVDHAEGE